MRKLSIYLDTSVINFLFADDSPEYKKVTEDFFDNYISDYDVYISEIVFLEVNKTVNPKKKEELLYAIEKYQLEAYDTINIEIESLAKKYIGSGVVPKDKFEDALHIGFATYYEFDILLSWNFKHLANIKKQIEVNTVNKIEGYTKTLNLLNPMEVLYEK